MVRYHDTHSRWHSALIALLVMVVCCASVVMGKQDDRVFCDRLSTLVVRECPIAYPVCCIWPNNVFTACCPEHSLCDLYTGECVVMSNRSTVPPELSGEIVPGVHGTDEKGKGIEVSLQFASSMVGIFFFGFLLLVSSAVQYGKVVAYRRELRRQQAELEARELLVAAGDEEDVADGADPLGNVAGDANDDDDDDSKLCKVCFCNRVDCALLKCGHIVCCRWCAKKLALCPICREPVTKLVRLSHVEDMRKALGERTADATPPLYSPAGPSPPTVAAVESGRLQGSGDDDVPAATADGQTLDTAAAIASSSHYEADGHELLVSGEEEGEEREGVLDEPPTTTSTAVIIVDDSTASS